MGLGPLLCIPTSCVSAVTVIVPSTENITIFNQQFDGEQGITDIEITDYQTFHIIFDAKRGWNLPDADQLTKYSLRNAFTQTAYVYKHIVTLSECSQTYALAHLPFHSVNSIPFSHLSYREVYEMAQSAYAGSNHEQKHLLLALCEYLRGVMTMQKLESNMVYVVALGTQNPDGCPLSWIDIVLLHQKYFCPMGTNGWPKTHPIILHFVIMGSCNPFIILKAILSVAIYMMKSQRCLMKYGIPTTLFIDWDLPLCPAR